MTKTFDQICKGILGEMIAPTMAPGQPPKPGQPVQQQGQPPKPGQPTPSSQPVKVDPAILKMIIDADDDVKATAALTAYTQAQSSQTKTNPSQPAQQPNAANQQQA